MAKSFGKKKKAKTKASKSNKKPLKNLFLKGVLFLILVFIVYVAYINYQVIQHIDNGQFSIPSRVYARPLHLRAGLKLSQSELVEELNLLSYRNHSLQGGGSYRQIDDKVQIYRRHFNHPNAPQNAGVFSVEFKQGYISDIYDDRAYVIDSLLLDPVLISSFYGKKDEDRLLLSYDEIPDAFKKTLIAVEDRQFYDHFGLNPAAILRALWVNIKAGKTLQGGSTITQQLVKNLFLSSKRSIFRKINEALYAVLIERYMDKNEILTTYINQVFSTQKKGIAIHGFALASQTLFSKPLNQLGLEQQALLIAMIKGPSFYHPVRNPKRAFKRRNLVIDIMFKQHIIDLKYAKLLKQKPLGLRSNKINFKRFQAFVDLVKKQLPSHYDKAMLKSSGLRIFTTLDPLVQRHAARAVKKNTVLKQNKQLQTANVIVHYATGNILSVIASRDPSYPGFNRAILAQRPIGSLIKPLLLYTLLEQGESLATKVKDLPITLKQSDGKLWSPNNYDSKLHGEVSLYQALVYSYNLPFVRIGLKKSLNPLVALLEKFKLQKNDVIYPSLLLGSIDLTPLEVAQIYQTLANDGLYSPLTSIRYVTDKNNVLLTKNPIETIQLLNKVSTAQVQSAMRGVVDKGTAKHLKSVFPNTTLAGKTATTDGYKDSWFVGYSERLVGVVWMGHDKNKTTHLTGSSGALRLWADIFKRLTIKPLKPAQSEAVEWVSTDSSGLFLMDSRCAGSQLLPFRKGEHPIEEKQCDDSILKRATNWLSDLFN